MYFYRSLVLCIFYDLVFTYGVDVLTCTYKANQSDFRNVKAGITDRSHIRNHKAVKTNQSYFINVKAGITDQSHISNYKVVKTNQV